MPLHSSPFFHGTAVYYAGRGALFIGPSGSGKSSLAAELISRGASLIGDDRLDLESNAARLIARPREGYAGMLECRGVGILNVPSVEQAEIHLVVDMSRETDERLPPTRKISLLGCTLPLLHPVREAHFPAALLLSLAQAKYLSSR